MKKPTVRHKPPQPPAPPPETRPSGSPRHPTRHAIRRNRSESDATEVHRPTTEPSPTARQKDETAHSKPHPRKGPTGPNKKLPHAVLPVSVFRHHLHRRRSCARSPWRSAQPDFEMEKTPFFRTASAPTNGSFPDRPHRRASTIGCCSGCRAAEKILSSERISGYNPQNRKFQKDRQIMPPKKNCTHTALAFHRSEKKRVPTETEDASDGVRPDNASAITQKSSPLVEIQQPASV